ncbi:hypothetical protein PR002_g7038 [Phytophthora rubi]|uniref:Uncharacterized protein n=1 Tax=Phytophthora rubi TaxID=129364 RepID=A0A6A3MTT9_9STRA|nr:hypothetical protein PR002_g7038 [Phytophthora rubi]
MDFRKKELKYRDERGDKVILPFTCNGITSLRQGERNAAVVRLAKTVKLTTNTRNIVRVAVDAPDGTTGIFLPKTGTKRHLLVAPTVDVVRDGVVRIAVLNVEGKREKLPWIPTEEIMEILSLNGELERERVAVWVSTLRKENAPPHIDEDKLDIGELEAGDRNLVVAVLRQYAEAV